MKKFRFKLSAKMQVCLHILTVLILLFLIYAFLGCPAFSNTDAFRRAEKAAMVGPSTILGQIQPAEYPCDALILGEDDTGAYLYVMHRGSPETSELIYREKQGNMVFLAAPGDTLYQYETRARIPMILFDGCKDARRAELDMTLKFGSFEKTYRLEAVRETEGFFYFDLAVKTAGSLETEGEALRLLQEICSNSMAGNADVAFPVAVRLYDGADALILESQIFIHSAAGQAQPQWPGYSGTMDGYEYCHTEERDRKWEEDILYLAERYMESYPVFVDEETVHQRLTMDPETFRFQDKYEYSDEFYDEAVKNAFLASVNELIPRVPNLTDVEMEYELNRILTVLKDVHAGISVRMGYRFPIEFEAIYEDAEPAYYAVRVPQGLEHLLLGKLTAINGVPIDDIVDRFRAYQPYENEYGLIDSLANSYCWGCFLTEMNAMHVIGVAESGATDAVFSFETETGATDATLGIVSEDEFEAACEAEQLVSHPMLKEFAFNAGTGNYWHALINDGKTMYIRFYRMYEEPDYRLSDFRGEVQKIVRESDMPLQIVIDFRNNHGGKPLWDELSSLIVALNQSETNGVHILINHGCYSAGVIVPYSLSLGIQGAQLIGSPTGQIVNTFGNSLHFTLPHHGHEFTVPTTFHWSKENVNEDGLYPDIWIEQTLDDYKNGVDAVMDYVLSLS